MDVVVTPVQPDVGIWTLRDRLGRYLGQLKRLSENAFIIYPEGDLDKMPSLSFSSQDAAMSAIEKHMKGSCELASPGSMQL